MLLYTGTSHQAFSNIIKNGFQNNFIGSNYGTTYGEGFYFTPDYEVAKSYSTGIIIWIDIDINLYNLDDFCCSKDFKKQRKQIIKLRKTVEKTHDGFIKYHRKDDKIIETEVIIFNAHTINLCKNKGFFN